MACTNGSRKKTGAPSNGWVNGTENVDGNVLAAIRNLSLVAVEYVSDVGAFCSAAPPTVEDITAADLLNPANLRLKVIAAGKAARWSEWCECIPNTGNNQCFQILHTNCADQQQVSYYCAETVEIVPSDASCNGEFNGVIWLVDGQQIGPASSYTQRSATVSVVNDSSNPPAGRQVFGNCNSCATPTPPDPPDELGYPSGAALSPPVPAGGPGSECGECPPGPPGPQGEPGIAGQDFMVEFEDYTVQRVVCEEGVEQIEDVIVPVVAGLGGSLGPVFALIVEMLGEVAKKQLCEKETEITETQIGVEIGYPGMDITFPNFTIAVQTTVITLPTFLGRRFGPNTNSDYDDKFDFGGYSWKYGDFVTEEQQLQWSKQHLPVPEGATGLRLYVQPGITVSAVALVKTEVS